MNFLFSLLVFGWLSSSDLALGFPKGIPEVGTQVLFTDGNLYFVEEVIPPARETENAFLFKFSLGARRSIHPHLWTPDQYPARDPLKPDISVRGARLDEISPVVATLDKSDKTFTIGGTVLVRGKKPIRVQVHPPRYFPRIVDGVYADGTQETVALGQVAMIPTQFDWLVISPLSAPLGTGMQHIRDYNAVPEVDCLLKPDGRKIKRWSLCTWGTSPPETVVVTHVFADKTVRILEMEGEAIRLEANYKLYPAAVRYVHLRDLKHQRRNLSVKSYCESALLDDHQ